MSDRIVKCIHSDGDDGFTEGVEYTLFGDDTVADDDGEVRPAFVAISGVVAGNSFFEILRFK